MKKLSFLREKYPKFVYRNYAYKMIGGNLKIVFDFRIEPNIRFKPEIIIKNIPKPRLKKIGDRAINNFVFHLGLMEIPSYWKATCSPVIEIPCGYLKKEQINWWENLIIRGMGQFFYENKIDWRKPNFLSVRFDLNGGRSNLLTSEFKNRYLVPVSGGKDSIVTLEKLKKRKKEIVLFLVNPTKQTQKVAKAAGIKKQVIVERTIDKKLLDLNKKGYLNGHTPFTAVLSFLSVFCAVLFDCKNITFSNEKSANEGNVKYLGKIINHQWAKSSEFEKMFRQYSQKYLTSGVEYFSYLRKYGELEISKMFSKYKQYFPVFSSCNNRGARWCGNCPKCLFVYMSLYPFLEKKQLLKIFGRDFFENKDLLPIMKALIGQGRHKPFECVGTYQESRLAFKLSLKKALRQAQDKPLPYLLQKFNEIE